MFDIQEIDDLVCRQLNQHDLTQCARVNKKWHAAVVPYIWRSPQCFGPLTSKAQLFRKMVLEDFVGACALERISNGPTYPSTATSYFDTLKVRPIDSRVPELGRTHWNPPVSHFGRMGSLCMYRRTERGSDGISVDRAPLQSLSS
ncbi:hypothetical protein B0O80DRAFT_454098 [Mortierella sp. GBAus27b]|nr:hypothetical protein B0O80DRAFT_454098 [Mortierella sp. GBAus27b]